ncbi:zinc-ribbon domain-containing protein, partial [bacterium]|nr:zinc-ribbon domain-containing protein [bacterium]
MAQSPEPLRRMETMDVVCPHCQAHFQVDPNMPADQPARALHAADEFVEAGGTPALPAGAQVEAGGTPALPAV